MGTIIAIILGGLYGAGVYLWGYFSGKREGYNIGYNTGFLYGMQRSRLFTFGERGTIASKTEEEADAE